MTFAVGERVAVLYDGKFTRAVEAEITDVKPDKTVVATFLPFVNEEGGLVSVEFRPEGGKYKGWLVGKGERGVMSSLGCKGDCYRLLKLTNVTDEGYRVRPYVRINQ